MVANNLVYWDECITCNYRRQILDQKQSPNAFIRFAHALLAAMKFMETH